MNTNVIIAVIVIILLAIGGFFLLSNNEDGMLEITDEIGQHENESGASSGTGSTQPPSSPQASPGTGSSSSGSAGPVPTPSPDPTPEAPAGPALSATITYLGSGYNSSDVTIAKGGTITFVNESSKNMWPASNIHPSHTQYPGSSRSKCGGSDENNIFDACTGLGNGATYSFTFDEVGAWRYHDHLNPSAGGTITVQ